MTLLDKILYGVKVTNDNVIAIDAKLNQILEALKDQKPDDVSDIY